ncbi:hypothetical protein, partial [Sphingomonas sp.]|uniref:hypothetical protein n=1 Tax=Sphingomonas sp. TaxID=28214 RepID=UPI00345049DB|nr:hypothetical protein [Sphingomonas sp.]
ATVTVRRGGESGTVRLAGLYDQPRDNIALQPGDVVIVRGVVGTVNVLGAAGVQGRVKITRHDYSLMDALGDARGLDNSAADPAAVYVMRQGDMTATNALPKVYHFDLRNPVQIAVANAFMLHNGDAVLISNASFAQYQKVISTFSGIVNSSRAVTTIP